MFTLTKVFEPLRFKCTLVNWASPSSDIKSYEDIWVFSVGLLSFFKDRNIHRHWSTWIWSAVFIGLLALGIWKVHISNFGKGKFEIFHFGTFLFTPSSAAFGLFPVITSASWKNIFLNSFPHCFLFFLIQVWCTLYLIGVYIYFGLGIKTESYF